MSSQVLLSRGVASTTPDSHLSSFENVPAYLKSISDPSLTSDVKGSSTNTVLKDKSKKIRDDHDPMSFMKRKVAMPGSWTLHRADSSYSFVNLPGDSSNGSLVRLFKSAPLRISNADMNGNSELALLRLATTNTTNTTNPLLSTYLMTCKTFSTPNLPLCRAPLQVARPRRSSSPEQVPPAGDLKCKRNPPVLPDTLFESFMLYLDIGGRVRPVSCASTCSLTVERKSPCGRVPELPTEIIQHILGYLSPVDFDAARHTCQNWLTASLNVKLLELQLRRGGWWSAVVKDLQEHDPSALQMFLSKLLSEECSFGAAWKNRQIRPMIRTSSTNFTALARDQLLHGEPKLQFTVSACCRFLLVSQDKTISVYSCQMGELWPVCSIVCPHRVLETSMDTSSKKYTVAALLEGRNGMVADLISSIVGPHNWERKAVFPISAAPSSFYEQLCSDNDPPRSVAICPSHRCVAFGCASGVQLQWIDAVTEQEQSRQFPLSTPADSLYFLPPRWGIDSATKMRLISSTASTDAQPSTLRSRLARRASDNLHNLWNNIGRGTGLGAGSPDTIRDLVTRSTPNGCGHHHAIPMSDGYHVLFTDPVTNLLCIGCDAPVGGPTRLAQVVVFIPPDNLSCTGQRLGSGIKIRPPTPTVYSAAPSLAHNIRVVAAYGSDVVVLYSVPGDIFTRSFATQTSTSKSPPSNPHNDSTTWMEWLPDVAAESTWAAPPTIPETFPVPVQGICIGKTDSDIIAVAVEAHATDVVVWAVGSDNQVVTWRSISKSLDGLVQKKAVQSDGRIVCEGSVIDLGQIVSVTFS